MNRNMEIAVLVAVLVLSACSGGSRSSSGIANNLESPASSRSTSTSSGSGTTASGSYSIGGTVTGLTGSGLTLQLNGGADLAVAADGAFTFPAALPNGTAYIVTVSAQPAVSREICGVSSGTGTMSMANITNVVINCSAVIGFLYQLGPDQIYSYGISANTGVLIAYGPPTPAGPMPVAIAVAPGGNYLYVTSSNVTYSNPSGLPGSISTFSVDYSTGSLTPVGSPVPAGEAPNQSAISSGGYLFVFDWNDGEGYAPPPAMTSSGPQTLLEYALDPSSGVPSLMGPVLTFPATAANSTIQVAPTFAATPDGRYLYVLMGSPELNSSISYTLTVYAIDPATGALTAGASISPGDGVSTMTIDPLGRFLYLTNSLGTSLQESGTVQPYAIDSSNGALTAIGAGTAVVSNGGGLAADPTGNHLYLISNLNWDAASNTIQALSVDPSAGSVGTIGSLIQTPGAPTAVLCDPSGQFVFVQSGPLSISPSAGVVLTTFSISTSLGTAGQLMPSGPSQPSASQAGGPIAIVE
jgi:6-phosphogluconolactonase